MKRNKKQDNENKSMKEKTLIFADKETEMEGTA